MKREYLKRYNLLSALLITFSESILNFHSLLQYFVPTVQLNFNDISRLINLTSFDFIFILTRHKDRPIVTESGIGYF